MTGTDTRPDPELAYYGRRIVTQYRWREQNTTRPVYLARQLRAVELGAGHLTADERTRLRTALAHAGFPPPAPDPGAPARRGAQATQRIQKLPVHVRSVERSVHLLTADEQARLQVALDVEPTPTPPQETAEQTKGETPT